jgi:hypothetical protein
VWSGPDAIVRLIRNRFSILMITKYTLPYFVYRRRTGGSGSSGEDSDLSDEDTTTRSLHSSSSHSDESDADDYSLSEDEPYFSDSEEDEDDDVVVEGEEEEVGRSLESLLTAAQATAILPALWLACIWLRAQPEVLAGSSAGTGTPGQGKHSGARSVGSGSFQSPRI